MLQLARQQRTLFSAILASLILTGCPKDEPGGSGGYTPGGVTVDNTSRYDDATQKQIDKADARIRDRDFNSAAKIYEKLADTTDPQNRAVFLLNAAKLYAKSGRLIEAKDALGRIDLNMLDSDQNFSARMLQSRILIKEGRARQVLDSLPTSTEGLSDRQTAEVLEIRGTAQLQLGLVSEGLNSLIARERYLSNNDQIAENQRLIYINLIQNPNLGLSGGLDTGNSVVSGWLELGRIGRTQSLEPEKFSERVNSWQAQYQQHPANRYLVKLLLDVHEERSRPPKKVALLLPMTGRYARAATGLRDGFMSARFSADQKTAPKVKVYDTNKTSNAALAYKQAVKDGAELVIGPLRGNAIDQVSRLERLPVPVLALNTIPRQTRNMTQLSLKHELEAEQVADHVTQQGFRYAVVLGRNDNWGRRVAGAFQQRFESQGGVVLDDIEFDPNEKNFQNILRKQVRPAVREAKKMDREASGDLGYRGSAGKGTMIFLAGFFEQARAIGPQRALYRLERVPMYATSRIYKGSPDAARDRDMNGMVFGDMPVLLGTNAETKETTDQIKNAWPKEFRRLGRFYALGHDAYLLAPLLKSKDSNLLPWHVAGATGGLSVDNAGRVIRRLSWARFRKGLAEPFDALNPQ